MFRNLLGICVQNSLDQGTLSGWHSLFKFCPYVYSPNSWHTPSLTVLIYTLFTGIQLLFTESVPVFMYNVHVGILTAVSTLHNGQRVNPYTDVCQHCILSGINKFDFKHLILYPQCTFNIYYIVAVPAVIT